jgi:DNA processing protein
VERWGERERRALVALACAVEPGTTGIADAVAEHGPEAVLSQHRLTVASAAIRGRLEPGDVPAMLTRMAQQGVRVVVHGDSEYPGHLGDLPEPPLVLWVRGPLDLRASALRAVSVVGARACTAYGERATAALAGPLADEGWTIVSGAAFGIDAAAHRAALSSGGATIAFMACGVDVAYPRAHDALLAQIGDVGAVVSELPPGSKPLRHRFLGRNRLIAGLGRGTVVVEAARRSGALSTAHRALEFGRVLMAVPGPITSMSSAGTNQLIHDQSARAVSDSSQVVGLLTSAPGEEAAPALPGSSVQGELALSLDATEGSHSSQSGVVLASLPYRGARCIDDVARRSGLPPVVCLAQLGVLELSGLVRRSAEGWRRCQ